MKDLIFPSEMAVKAAQNRPFAFPLIKEFLELLGNAFPITDSVIIAMAKSPSRTLPEYSKRRLQGSQAQGCRRKLFKQQVRISV